jgi:deazaflavin-dependent oxidoreductase (nitroreductase family)
VNDKRKTLDDKIAHALKHDRVIEITAIGRRSGQRRRVRVWSYRSGGKVYLSGLPGPRDWYANLVAHPDFTFHLIGSTTASLRAHAIPITDETARREIMSEFLIAMNRISDLDTWVKGSPLIEVQFVDLD